MSAKNFAAFGGRLDSPQLLPESPERTSSSRVTVNRGVNQERATSVYAHLLEEVTAVASTKPESSPSLDPQNLISIQELARRLRPDVPPAKGIAWVREKCRRRCRIRSPFLTWGALCSSTGRQCPRGFGTARARSMRHIVADRKSQNARKPPSVSVGLIFAGGEDDSGRISVNKIAGGVGT